MTSQSGLQNNRNTHCPIFRKVKTIRHEIWSVTRM